MSYKPDKWASWLGSGRYANNKILETKAKSRLEQIRDKVIRNASIIEGDTLLDIGTGDGLIGLEALRYVGAEGIVLFSDISEGALEICRNKFDQLNSKNGEFLLQSADNLDKIGDGTIDVITARAVVMYIEDKQKCFNELHRVLKPGGRLSIFEPINQFSSMRNRTFLGLDFSDLPFELAQQIVTPFGYPLDFAKDPLINFNEDDIFNFVEKSGFEEIKIEYSALRTMKVGRRSWEDFLKSSPNPIHPPLQEVLDSIQDATKRKLAISFLQQAWDRPLRPGYNAEVYLVATKRFSF